MSERAGCFRVDAIYIGAVMAEFATIELFQPGLFVS